MYYAIKHAQVRYLMLQASEDGTETDFAMWTSKHMWDSLNELVVVSPNASSAGLTSILLWSYSAAVKS